MALTCPACLPAHRAPSHGGTTAATARASQLGREAAGGPAAGLHQPASADPGEDGRGPRIASWVPACRARRGWLSSGASRPVHQAQQMTTQAMTLSLEQQAKQLQKQSQALALAPAPAPATAPAPAPRAASLTSPPPAITHKPKKTPTPQKEPESGLELVGACLRVRSQGWGDGRAWDGQLASGLQTWETWGVGDGAAGRCRKDAARPRPCGSEWVRCVSGNLVGKAAPSVALPASRRPRRSLKTGTHGPGASNRSETISRSWVSALGEAIRHRLRHRPSLARGWGVALWSGWPVQEPNVLSHSVVCNSVRPHGL